MKTPSVKKMLGAFTLLLCVSAMATPVAAAEVGGVQYQTTAQAGHTRLLLNGVGLRQLASGNLYSVGLYAEKKLASAQEVFNATGATQLRLVMLRDISSRELSDMLAQGLISTASDEALSSLISEVFDVGLMLSEKGNLLAGDTFQIDSHPLTGTTISIRGATIDKSLSQTFANPHLFKVMMGIWLGANPVDSGLKSALLGQSI